MTQKSTKSLSTLNALTIAQVAAAEKVATVSAENITASMTKRQNVGMVFDEESHPIAIYWKNAVGMKWYLLKEMNETDTDALMAADNTPQTQ